MTGQEANDMLRLIETVKYLGGIAEKGEGRQQREDETTEQFVLGYVKRLESLTRVANCGTADSFIACDDDTKRKWFALSLRESTMRKRAESDAETYAAQAHKLALELECLMSEFAMVPEGAKWWDSAMNALDDWHRIRVTIQPSIWEGVSPSGVVPPNVELTGAAPADAKPE